MEVINEGSSITLTISFMDSDNNPVTPLALAYKIYDKDTNTVLDSASGIVPLTTSYDLDILGTINSMVNEDLNTEVRTVIIEWEWNNDQTDVYEYDYKIRNVVGV
jgi:hypothetical protein